MSVVVAYTPSPAGRRALDAGAGEARLRKLPLHVVTVMAHDVGDSPTRAKRDMQSAEAAEEHLEQIAGELAADDLAVSTELVHGQLGEETGQVLEAMRRAEAQLLVVGIRRRSPVGKLVLGSVSRDLLLASPVPVLAVKAERE